MELERGVAGRLPYFAVGAGTPPLVFIAGLSPRTGVDSRAMRRADLATVKPYARERRVVFFNRRPGLPRGMTMAELAGTDLDPRRQ